jgi:hypothetical protein
MLQTINPIATYNTALSAYKRATARMQKLRGMVVLAGGLMRGNGWKSAIIAGFPTPLGLEEPTFFIGPDWPSLEDLGLAIATWRHWRQELEGAWQAVPWRARPFLEQPPLL